MPRMLLLAVLTAVAVVAAACGGSNEAGADGKTSKLTLVAYSTPREVYEELIPKFQATEAGRGVDFEQSYGSSGEQSRAVEAGLPANIVALSLAPDVDRLADAGLVADGWADDELGGMVSRSVVVLAVRKGNPKHIRGWDDLVRDGIEVITPNPFTSGGARWNAMAAYGAQVEQGASKDEAVDYLRRLFHNVSVQDKSARESLQTFLGGKGDVLLAYENEAITAQQKGEELAYIVPDQTILIENPIAVTTNGGETAQAFVDFARSPEAQRVFAEKGYRSIRDDLVDEATYPTPPSLFRITDLGGWPDVQRQFFDRESGIMADIQREVGAPLDD
jgi:sulfate/thiosulfate transport system substrate-binding protein